MKKLLIFTAALALLLTALMPFCLGLALEYGFKLALVTLEGRPELAVSHAHFERSYASSRAQLTLNPVLEGQPQVLMVEIQFQHGPVLKGAGFGVGLLGVTLQVASAGTQQLKVTLPDKPIYRLAGAINWGGNFQFTDTYNPLSVRFALGSGEWGGGQGSGRIDVTAKRFFYEGHLNQLVWQSSELELQMDNLDINKEGSFSSTGLSWISRVVFQSAHGRWDDETFTLNKGALGVSRAAADTTERWQLSLVTEKLVTRSLQLNVLDANIAFNQVPADWLAALIGLSVSSTNETAYAQQANQLNQYYLPPSQAVFVIERIGALQGDKAFWFSGQTQLAKLVLLPREKWQTAQSLLKEIDGTGEVHLDKTLLSDWIGAYMEAQNGNGGVMTLPPTQIDLFAKAFVGQGMLTDEGTLYGSKITLKQGEMLLNGLPMPLPF